MGKKMNTRQVRQVAILTKDVKKTAAAWAMLLQVPVPPIVQTDAYEKTGAIYNGKPCHAILHQAFFEFENIQLELIQPLDDIPSIWRDCLDKDGEGLHHITFHVKDMEANIVELEKEMPLIQKGEYEGGRYAYMDARENLNIILELIENDGEGI